MKNLVAKALLISSIGCLTVACRTTPSTSTQTLSDSAVVTDAQTIVVTDAQPINSKDSQDVTSGTPDEEMPVDASDRPDFSMLEANAIYEEQDFSEALYAQFLEAENFCIATGQCGDVRYLFKDALLVVSMMEFGSTETRLVPHQAVSKPEALRYARILDTDGVIDFSDSVVEDGYEGEGSRPETVRESYFEADLPEEGAAYELGSAQMVRLTSPRNSSPDGKISEVSLIMTVF